MCPSDRPRGGRRPEDFPDVRERDARILEFLTGRGQISRNDLARYLSIPRRKVSYALHRLRSAGKVRRVPQGNEGHGTWEAITDGDN